MGKLTQTERVYRALSRAPDGVCSWVFMYDFSPRITQAPVRIFELRGEGFPIVTEDCDLHDPRVAPEQRHCKYRMADYVEDPLS